MDWDWARLELFIIVLLVISQVRDSMFQKDRAEENRANTAEGMRKGWEAHKELTAEAVVELRELYRDLYRDAYEDASVLLSPDDTEPDVFDQAEAIILEAEDAERHKHEVIG